MTHRDGTEEPGGADEIAAARDALDGRHEPLDGRHDWVSDVSEMDTLRLENEMDRDGRMQGAPVNTLEEQSETQDPIADNLK